MLHEHGYAFTGPKAIGLLTRHEIHQIRRNRREVNKTPEERKLKWKEEQLAKLDELNYETMRKKTTRVKKHG